MLKIGATDWGQCPRCIHYDEEHGCKKALEIETMCDDENSAVICLTGQTSECDDYADVGDVDWEEPWE